MIQRVFHCSCSNLLLIMFFVSSGCRNTSSQIVVLEPVLMPVVMEKQEPLIVQTDTSLSLFTGLRQKASVAKYYQIFGGDPVWVEGRQFSRLADSMLLVIRHAQYYGLPRSLYHLSELENLSQHSGHVNTVRKELLLTDAFLSFSGDLKFGLRNPKQKQNEDSLRINLLSKVLSNGDLLKILESQEPKYEGYHSLKEGLRMILDSAKVYDIDSVSMFERIRLISINMERWRRETETLGSRYIFINIPSFMLDVVSEDSIAFSSKVIVGTQDTETPILSSLVECFSIYPYWHVPRKISVDEYLPILKKDTTFLRRNNFDVLDHKGNVLDPDSVAWNTFNQNYFPVVLRQREGTENSLGIIKFIFDNPYAVYLHDTNAKRLFKSTSRAFSHGCIRMEKAVELAHYLVTGSVGEESKTISKYLKQKQQRWIDLKSPIPIYTRYFTCDYKNGVLHVYKDIYCKDRQLYDLIYKDKDNLDL